MILVTELSTGSKVVSVDNDERAVVIHLENILAFTTGADKIPPMGFHDALKVLFLEDSELPKASTCSLCLFLSLKSKDYDQFKDKMVEGIVGGYGFGNM